jgi:hypothetical protein
MAGPSKIKCSDYRQEMMLLELRNRLERKDLPNREREEVEQKIRKLEEDLCID